MTSQNLLLKVKAANKVLYVIRSTISALRGFQVQLKVFEEFEEVIKYLHEAELRVLQIIDVAEIKSEKEICNGNSSTRSKKST